MMMLVYLACPYTGSRHKSWFECARYVSLHENVFSPIVHMHHVSLLFDLPGDAYYWSSYNKIMMSRCDKLVVIKMAGWSESVGVTNEIGWAKEFGIPVEYVPAVGDLGGCAECGHKHLSAAWALGCAQRLEAVREGKLVSPTVYREAAAMVLSERGCVAPVELATGYLFLAELAGDEAAREERLLLQGDEIVHI